MVRLRAAPTLVAAATRSLASTERSVRHVTKISDLTRAEIEAIVSAAATLKARPISEFKVRARA